MRLYRPLTKKSVVAKTGIECGGNARFTFCNQCVDNIACRATVGRRDHHELPRGCCRGSPTGFVTCDPYAQYRCFRALDLFDQDPPSQSQVYRESRIARSYPEVIKIKSHTWLTRWARHGIQAVLGEVMLQACKGFTKREKLKIEDCWTGYVPLCQHDWITEGSKQRTLTHGTICSSLGNFRGKCVNAKGQSSYQKIEVFRRRARDLEGNIKTESYELRLPEGYRLLGEKTEPSAPRAPAAVRI